MCFICLICESTEKRERWKKNWRQDGRGVLHYSVSIVAKHLGVSIRTCLGLDVYKESGSVACPNQTHYLTE